MNITVADIMTRDPVTLEPETNLLECAKKMVRKRVKMLFLTDKKKLTGIITERDIIWALIKKSEKDLSKIKASDISSKKIMTIKPNATLNELISKIRKTKFRRIPVLKNGELMGVVTAADILNFHPEIYPELKEISQIREEEEKLKRVERSKTKVAENEGICEECGARETLYKFNGMLVCDSCFGSS
ncbi:MAG: CBS domain-containing protein [archaeon]